MILYLDYDGCLHPSDVFLENGKPILMAPGQLFMWAPTLEAALLPCPEVEIVLSTNWVRHFGFARAKAVLSSIMQRKVIGAIWNCLSSDVEYDLDLGSTRYDQITRHAANMGLADADWFAIDDDNYGWPDDKRHQLVWCKGDVGLSDQETVHELQKKLGFF